MLRKSLILIGFVFALVACSKHHQFIDKNTVWRPSPQAFDELLKCSNNVSTNRVGCMVNVMQNFQASKSAIAFTKKLQGRGFAVEVKNYGQVAVVKTVEISGDYFLGLYLVGSNGSLISVTDQKRIGSYLWLKNYDFPRVVGLNGGKQGFVFRYERKRCRNCKPNDFFKLTFVFDKKGKFREAK